MKRVGAHFLRALGLLCGMALASAAASAQTTTTTSAGNPHRLDDSRSQTVPENAQMQWRPQNRAGQDAGMQAMVRVNIYIDTAAWKGRSGQVYMVLPQDQTGSEMEAVWTTNGTLLPGRLVSGERALVYAGRIGGEALEDQMQVRLRSGPDWLSQSRRLSFYFEIDVEDQSLPVNK